MAGCAARRRYRDNGPMRTGNMYGPDATFLGVPSADLDDESSFADAAAVIIGAPFDGGTSHRPGCRFGPQAIRITDYLPHDGSRPHLALGVDPLVELGVVDVGDVIMPSGETELSLERLEDAVARISLSGAIPIVLGGDHTIAFPDVTGVARSKGWGRVSVIHFDAHADTGESQFGSLYGHGTPMRRLIESGAARGDRFLQIGLPRILARARDSRVDGGTRDAELRDERGGSPRSRRMPDRSVVHRARRL